MAEPVIELTAPPAFNRTWVLPGENEAKEPPIVGEGEVSEAEAASDEDAEPVAIEDDVAEESPRPVKVVEELSRSLSSGWPDESAWSQSFEWSAMKQGMDEDATPSFPVDGEAPDVGSIVAQVRAELEAARQNGTIPTLSFDDEHLGMELTDEIAGDEDIEGDDLDVDDIEAVPSQGGEAADVSSIVAQMRAELDAAREGSSVAAAEPADDVDVREEVRRAVEAARAELSGADGHKPPFPLAAPTGPLLDWSNTSVDISGPPVFVIKDSEGRVELASVFETLNEVHCGESAALLNYTPHSVTVGLPARSSVPSVDEITRVVLKVFGRRCRVESDGVRITVTIGEDSKSSSEGAA